MRKIEIEYLSKDEVVEKYLKLQEDYAELEQRYNDLDDCYSELERRSSDCSRVQKEYKELKETFELLENYSIGEFLREIRFDENLGATFNKELFKIYKEYFIELMRFYSVDIPDEVYDAKDTDCKLDNNRVYGLIENLVKDFEFSKSLK